ncbi:MAG: hypothetical protein A2145_02070 [candidate division Zixibacteria bacterium RBG_16_40_9]|nr:MAG: hypothetical protein A2145_02070 [candidate division Zixibacteria bacterium RBG_16_40_9]
MILTGVLLALAFWILETLIHAFIFHEGGLLQNLFPMEPNELWMRTLVCCLFIAYGIYAQFVVTRLKKSEEELLRLQGNKMPDASIYGITIPQQRVNGGPMIFLGVFAALTFWIVESFIHSSIFHEGKLLQNIFSKDPNELWMRIVVSCLLIALGIYAHSSFTKLKKSEEERLRLQKNLEESLTKLLSGFLPICANCKDIRAEDGTWVRIEGYLEKHSDVKFSHGICRKCAKVLYPDYVAKI